MINKHLNSIAPEKKTGNHKWIPVLILFMLMLLSYCGVGYILGRSAFPGSSGKRIDTILLTPDGEPAGPQARQHVFHLTGRINYTDGRPYARGRVQLHSEPRETVTDGNGNFSFFHVEDGEHQIRILNQTGTVLGERSVSLFPAQPESGVNVSLKDDGEYAIEVAVDVRLMEVVIELDERNNTLYINPENLTYLTSDGHIVTPAGEAHGWKGTLVTPGGLVITEDGTVVAPASEGPLGIAVLTPENQVVYPAQDTALPDGTKLFENGNILLPGETLIERNGNGTVILTPDGQRGQPGTGGIIISGDNQMSPVGPDTNAQDSLDIPAESVSGSSDGAGASREDPDNSSQNEEGGSVNTGSDTKEQEENTGGNKGSGDNSGSGDNNGSSGGSGGSNGGSGGSSGDSGGSSGGNGGGSGDSGGGSGGDHKDEGPIPDFYVSWTQGQEIELFSDLAGNMQTLLPGAQGSYPFILKNKNSFHVIFTLSIEEDSIHIPLDFRIVTEKDGIPVTDWWTVQTDGASVSDTVRINAGESNSYLLEWRWPYESGRDALDTEAGHAGGVYKVRLKIWAQQEGP